VQWNGRKEKPRDSAYKESGKKLEKGRSEEKFVFWNTTPDVDLICRLENRSKTARGVAVSPSINVRKRTHRSGKKNI
jgi:hypothetical protein